MRSVLSVATRVFMSPGAEPSLREIARESSIGIATLYRHFPTREALVAAVYAGQVARLTDGAPELLATYAPVEALRRWMDLFGDWIATKNGMLTTLRTMIESDEIAPRPDPHRPDRRHRQHLLRAGHAHGRAACRRQRRRRRCPSPSGSSPSPPCPEHTARAHRLIGVLIDGLRPDT